jgi:endonuclease YncB( thermonuclease family)
MSLSHRKHSVRVFETFVTVHFNKPKNTTAAPNFRHNAASHSQRSKIVEEVLMHRSSLIVLITFISFAAATAAANTLVVAEVHPGCLVEFEGGFTVHLSGISVPGPKTHVGYQAYDFAKRRLEGKRVAVFTWTTDNTAAGIVYGEDGLAFAKIAYGKGLSTDIAEELLELGLARVDPEHLPEGCEHYPEIEGQARAKKLGLWASDN